MAPCKVKGFVLQAQPYRESSCILHLFCDSLGLIHGLAKGIRKGKNRVPLERGFLIECLVYVRPNRSLHVLGTISILDLFPAVRNDLFKTAVRDTITEFLLKNLHQSEQNEKLFRLLELAYRSLQREQLTNDTIGLLWHFLYRFSSLSGFCLDFEQCIICKKPIGVLEECSIVVEKGGVVCSGCRSVRDTVRMLPGIVRESLLAGDVNEPVMFNNLLSGEIVRITKLLADYCTYHFETKGDYKSLDFLFDIINTEKINAIV